jgi:hypothetical protein
VQAKVGELVRGKMIDPSKESVLYKKIGQRDAHVLMAWTVFQCNGDDKKFVEALEKRC